VPTLIVIGLALGWLGDMLLVVPSTFLLGHVAYVAAFVASGIEQHFTMFGTLAVVAHGAPILVWLLPHVEQPMKLPVLAYVFVITLMVVAAAGSYGHSFVLEHPSLSCDNVADQLLNATLVTGTGTGSSSDSSAAIGSAVATPVSIAFRRLLAAELFFLSDICVARLYWCCCRRLCCQVGHSNVESVARTRSAPPPRSTHPRRYVTMCWCVGVFVCAINL